MRVCVSVCSFVCVCVGVCTREAHLCELHLVHALSSIPVKEGLAAEHGCELLADALEQLLDGGGVADERGSHLEPTRRNVAHGCLDVVGDPFHKVRAVLVLDVKHLLVDLLHGHAPTEHGGYGEVPAVTRITCGHHVLGVKHLLGELRYSECTVLLGSTARQRGKPWHEEVETREGDHVDGEFAEVCIELSGESQAGGDTAHGGRDQVVEIAIGWGGQFECAEADVIEGLVVNAVSFVGVLYQLVDRESGIVRLDDSVRNFRGGDDAEGVHDPVRVLFADLGDEEGAHPGASATSE